MVKGISRQVIVVHSPEQKLFEQAIFILRDDISEADCVSEETLLKEAKAVLKAEANRKPKLYQYGVVWAFAGAVITSLIWGISWLL